MEGMFLIFVLFFVLVIVLAVMNHQQEKKRREELAALAASHGWTFDAAQYRGYDARFVEFDFFDRGSNRYAHNILAGESAGFSLEAFDYHYETHSTDSKGKRQTHHHRFSVAILESPFPLKPLTIRPEGIFDKLSAAFGWDDIDFESAEFSGRFHVKSPDRRWAFDVIHQRAMEYLLNCPPLELHFSGQRIAVKGSGRFEAGEFAKAVEMAATMLSGIPEFARGGA